MPKKSKSPQNTKTDATEATVVTRIKAKDTASKKPAAKSVKTTTKPRRKLFGRGQKPDKGGEMGYFRGSWYELTQVRWPDRKSSWQMTFALIGFVGLFVLIVLLFDYGFQKLFDLIIR